ncbi:MAG: WD40 repeat domain-containing protein [Patescibacteria group bacterium]
MNFFARYKKFFLIVGFLALVGLIGYLLWILFFRAAVVIPPAETLPAGEISGLPSAGPSEGGEEIGEPGEGLPEAGGIPGIGAPSADEPNILAVGGLTKTTTLVSSPTLNPTLSSDGRIQYYNKDDGRFYKLDADGNPVLLSDKVFHNAENIVWSPDSDRAIIEYPDGNKILYNFTTKKQVTLPAHWQEFSFSPNSEQIVSESIGLDPDNRWLMASKDDGSQAVAIEKIGTRDNIVYPSWSPNNQAVAIYTDGIDAERQEVFFVGLNNENFKSTIIEGRGLEFQWSDAGDRLLYSVYHSRDNYNPRLWIVNAQGDSIGQNRISLDLATWADKCTFASNTEIYCAVPENLENGSGFFPELADRTKDNLYKIDLKTGAKKLIAVPDGAYNISQIIVPENQDYLYFTDKQTEEIYQVRLR